MEKKEGTAAIARDPQPSVIGSRPAANAVNQPSRGVALVLAESTLVALVLAALRWKVCSECGYRGYLDGRLDHITGCYYRLLSSSSSPPSALNKK